MFTRRAAAPTQQTAAPVACFKNSIPSPPRPHLGLCKRFFSCRPATGSPLRIEKHENRFYRTPVDRWICTYA